MTVFILQSSSIHIFMYYFSLIPNRSFTIPLKHFGTFFTTIVIFIHSPFYDTFTYLQDNHARPIIITAIPIANSQPDIGSNKTSKIPSPNPIKQTPIVFFNALNIFLYPLFLIYYIPFCFYWLPFYVVYTLIYTCTNAII